MPARVTASPPRPIQRSSGRIRRRTPIGALRPFSLRISSSAETTTRETTHVAAAPRDTGAIATVRYGTPAGRGVLLATILGSGMTQLDATIVNVALPRI